MVLAGGSSRRFDGKPKGLELVAGQRIIDRVASALARVTDQIVLAANDPDATRWLPGVPMVRDRHSGAGGLAGVDAALAWSEGRRDVLVVAWDMPFVPPAMLQALIDHAARSQSDVTLPESHSPYGFEPFCAYYSIRVAERLARFLAAGGGAAREFLKQVVLNRIPVAEVDRHGDSDKLLLSVNTPKDLARAAAIGAREPNGFG